MSTPISLPFAVGAVLPATSGIGKADLGKIYTTGNATYQVVKASTDLTAPAKFILVWADRAAFTVTTTTTASDPNVAGFVPDSVSGDIDTGEYFLLLLPIGRIAVTAISEGTVDVSASRGFAIVTSATAGEVDLTASTAVTTPTVGFCIEAAAGADLSAGDDISIVTL
jgi:hypothetical protein